MNQTEKPNLQNTLAGLAYELGQKVADLEFKQGKRKEADQIRVERQSIVDLVQEIKPSA